MAQSTLPCARRRLRGAPFCFSPLPYGSPAITEGAAAPVGEGGLPCHDRIDSTPKEGCPRSFVVAPDVYKGCALWLAILSLMIISAFYVEPMLAEAMYAGTAERVVSASHAARLRLVLSPPPVPPLAPPQQGSTDAGGSDGPQGVPPAHPYAWWRRMLAASFAISMANCFRCMALWVASHRHAFVVLLWIGCPVALAVLPYLLVADPGIVAVAGPTGEAVDVATGGPWRPSARDVSSISSTRRRTTALDADGEAAAMMAPRERNGHHEVHIVETTRTDDHDAGIDGGGDEPPALCRKCRAWVAGFDHHCAVLGVCIGRGTYGLFVSFLLLGSLVLTVGEVYACGTLALQLTWVYERWLQGIMQQDTVGHAAASSTSPPPGGLGALLPQHTTSDTWVVLLISGGVTYLWGFSLMLATVYVGSAMNLVVTQGRRRALFRLHGVDDGDEASAAAPAAGASSGAFSLRKVRVLLFGGGGNLHVDAKKEGLTTRGPALRRLLWTLSCCCHSSAANLAEVVRSSRNAKVSSW